MDPVLRRVFSLIDEMEELQKHKVLELARRLKPGLTAEDIRNPHDFPDLDDPDWHFEDGQLAGIQAVRFALHGLRADIGDIGEGEPHDGGTQRVPPNPPGSHDSRGGAISEPR